MSRRCAALDDTWKIRFRSNGQIKTSFVNAKDHKRAERLANSFPNVISVSKARNDYVRIEKADFSKFTDELMKDIAKPQMTPLAMDEFLWMRRNRRIENKNKDKNLIDK